MRNIFAKVIDTVALGLGVLILLFCWIRFYTKETTLSFFIALIIAVGAGVVFNLVVRKKESKILSTKEEQGKAQAFLLALLGSTQKEIIDKFYEIFILKGANVEKRENGLKIRYNSSQSEVHNTFIVPIFSMFLVNQNDILSVLKQARENEVSEIRIYAKAFSGEAKSFAKSIKNFQIELIEADKMYAEFAPTSLPITLDTSEKKFSRFELIKFALDKRRAKNYLLFGVIILLTSFLVPYKIYYLVMGSVLVLGALVVRVIPRCV